MIDTFIFLLVCLPLVCTIVWCIIERHEIDLHKREMEELWALYREEDTLPGNEEPIVVQDPIGPKPYSDEVAAAILRKHPKPPDL